MCNLCVVVYCTQMCTCLAACCLLMIVFFYNSSISVEESQDQLVLKDVISTISFETRNKLHRFIAVRHPENVCRVWAFPRISGVLESEFMNLSDQRWLESYRVPKRIFQQLVHSLQGVGRAATRMRRPVPVVTIVVMLLKRLGKGLDYQEIGDKFGVGASTACQKVNTAMSFLIETKKYMISRLQEGRNLEAIIEGFLTRWNFPLCLGAIDGTHIPIKAPQNHHTDYFNRKSFHSVILQAVCDSECRITDIFAGWPGRAHDARVFSRSNIGQKVINGTLVTGHDTLARDINGTTIEPFLVGDPAYPFRKHRMKDYTGSNLSPEKEYFNYRLNRARIQIERTFGLLKGRWRCLLRPLECDLANVVQHVIASCILHNICQEGDAEYLEEWDARDTEEVDDPTALGPLSDDVGVGNAQLIRNVLCQYITEN